MCLIKTHPIFSNEACKLTVKSPHLDFHIKKSHKELYHLTNTSKCKNAFGIYKKTIKNTLILINCKFSMPLKAEIFPASRHPHPISSQ